MDRSDSSGNALTHYGVKGMKWGVRKSDSSGGGSKKEKPGPSEDYARVKNHKGTIKSGGVKALSNKELREVVDRMNLEQQYKTLKSKEPNALSRLDKGHGVVKKLVGVGGTATSIYNMAQSPAGQALRRAMIGI